MEQIILISAQAYILYYIATNIYLVFLYIGNTNDFKWEDVAWLLVFGFLLITFIGISELEKDWRRW